MKKQQAGFWTYFAIILTIVAGMLSANLKADSPHPSFTVQVTGSGKPVLMIPGLMSDSRVWQPTAQALANHYQLHLISIAGFAGTPAIEGELLPRVQTELLQYIKDKQLTKPAVIGHSLGAFMAFALASRAPDAIGHIIAVDGLPYLAPIFTRDSNSTVASIKPQAEQLKMMYQGMSAEQLRAMTAQGLPIQAKSEADQQLVLDMAVASDTKAVGQAIYELLSTDLRTDVSNIRSQVLLLGAAGAMPESMHSQAQALYQQQISGIANAKLVFNYQARHFIMLDEPEWLLAHIIEQLAE